MISVTTFAVIAGLVVLVFAAAAYWYRGTLRFEAGGNLPFRLSKTNPAMKKTALSVALGVLVLAGFYVALPDRMVDFFLSNLGLLSIVAIGLVLILVSLIAFENWIAAIIVLFLGGLLFHAKEEEIWLKRLNETETLGQPPASTVARCSGQTREILVHPGGVVRYNAYQLPAKIRTHYASDPIMIPRNCRLSYDLPENSSIFLVTDNGASYYLGGGSEDDLVLEGSVNYVRFVNGGNSKVKVNLTLGSR